MFNLVPPFLPAVSHHFQNLWAFIKTNGDAIKTVSAVIAIVIVGTKLLKLLITFTKSYLNRRALVKRLESGSYTKGEISRATSYYVTPDCQNVDPSGGEDWRLTLPVRQNAFSAIDFLLKSRSSQKYSLILADSGMGKTSLLLNYFARHWKSRKRRSEFDLVLIPLGQPNIEQQIESVLNKANTVLFLDALDEDTKAIENHRSRLTDLLNLASHFRHVLITCRTQFFPRDEEIPAETGLLRVGPIAAGESKEHCFYKIYLSPFSDGQVDAFIRKRFRFWHLKDRAKARQIAKRIRDLTVRPMILAHIPDLLEGEANFTYTFQIYEEMVSAWLRREQPLVKNTATLRAFSEYLATDMLTERQKRGAEKVSSAELDQLLARFEGNNAQVTGLVKNSLERWQLRSRSLLNRDAAGNWKFAHRSIMEYSAATNIFDKQVLVPTILLTDQVKVFLWELYLDRRSKDPEVMPTKLVPVHRIRATPLSFNSMDSIMKEQKQTLAALGSESWPVSCEVDRRRFFHPELFRIARLSNINSIASAELHRIGKIKFIKGRRFYSDQEFMAPTIAVTDFVTGLRWHLYATTNDGTRTYFEDISSSEHFREPTVAEALSLEPILTSRVEIMARALDRDEEFLTVLTSDKMDRELEQQLFVQFKFEKLRMVSRQILHFSNMPQREIPGSLRAVLEKSPFLSAQLMPDESIDFDYPS